MRLGPYEIVAPIGAGGMGEVYRASDTRLDRQVAIKVLPAELSSNVQLRARFDREARAISALTHPNICTLYDVGRHDGIDFLVMEYIEGETLADRIGRGAMPIEDVLRIGSEIAAALDRAHRAGIVHRDLKPGNVILTRSGAKLLDFGLAKSTPFASAGSATIRLSNPLTSDGMIVGTVPYMAPEQLMALEADARTDIFAFGAVLYEMATGRRAFDAESQASLIAQILEHDPPPMTSLRPMTPRSLDRVVRTCLAKNRDDRFQTAHDVLLQLRWVRDDVSQPDTALPAVRRRVKREHIAWGVAAALAIAAIVLAISILRRPPAIATTTSILPPPGTTFLATGDYAGPPVISPDGTRLAFVASAANGKRSLWLRSLASGAAREIDGSINAQFPFWSPDSWSVAFFLGSQIKSADINGGPANVVVDNVIQGRGGTWTDAGMIVYAPKTRDGLWKVPAAGGTPLQISKLAPPFTTYRWPIALPGGKWIVYEAANHNNPSSRDASLHLLSIDGKVDRLLMPSLANAVYASGKLLYLRENTLYEQAFDATRLRLGLEPRLTGEPRAIAQNVRFDLSIWRGVFDASQNGILTYQAGGNLAGTRPTWYDAAGKQMATFGDLGSYFDVQLSPDARRVAVSLGDPHSQIWVDDLDSNTRTRLTFEGFGSADPLWTPDGSQIIYASADTDNGASKIYARPAVGGARRIVCCADEGFFGPVSISPDGKSLLALDGFPGSGKASLVVLPAAGGARTPVVRGDFEVFGARFSPDGRWIAYASNESRSREVFVIPYPAGAGKWQVTTTGGSAPLWSRDGKHLYYVAPDDMLMVVDVRTTKDAVEFSPARPLFRVAYNTNGNSPIDVAPDGRILTTGAEEDAPPLTLVTGS